MPYKVLRSRRGQAFVPVILIAFLAVLAIGIFTFEVTRATIVRDQLRTATEAAALAGAAELAGSSQLDTVESQNNAIAAARSVLAMNDIFGVHLDKIEDDFSNSPQSNHVKVRFRYLDPKTFNVPVPLGDPRGKVLQVETKFGLHPVFASYVGMSDAASVAITAIGHGGVGDLDIALCFDVSGSMDDETLMTKVRRRWDPGAGRIQYDLIAQGKLATSSGAVFPQQLEFAAGFNPQLRGSSETSPPGNFPPGAAGVSGFTDAVVNLDEQTSFAGFSIDGFDFPNVATLVEAARGNLENDAVFQSSQAKTALGGIVTPKPGYRAKYFQIAAQHIHPLIEAQTAAKEFFQLMNKNANSHFALVTFHTDIGQNPTFVFPAPNVASSYAPGGNGRFPLPTVPLKKPEASTNFDEVTAGLNGLVAFGGTNIGGATNRAIQMFETESRPMAKKVIILFTDGFPTVGSPSPQQACRNAAQVAHDKGIAIYPVGLALDPSLIPLQTAILSETSPNGMAKIAGHGSRYFQVTSTNNLRAAFASIARQLSQLTE